MTANISISDAAESDLPDMVAIRCDGNEEDMLTRFLYGHRHSESRKNQTKSLMASLGNRFTHPTNRCYIIKAVDTQTNELVGWSLLRWEPPPVPHPAGFGADQHDFIMHYQKEVRKNWVKQLAGKNHVVLGALFVRPDRQGLGIGRQLVDHLYSKYDLEKELVIVQTSMAEGFYHKLGWVTVDNTDIDLSEWGGKGRGFGLLRNPQMLRYPKLSEP